MGDLATVERAWADEVSLLNESNERLAKALRALLEAVGDLRGEKSWAWHAITEAESQARAANWS